MILPIYIKHLKKSSRCKIFKPTKYRVNKITVNVNVYTGKNKFGNKAKKKFQNLK
jgi:hypothetical protein